MRPPHCRRRDASTRSCRRGRGGLGLACRPVEALRGKGRASGCTGICIASNLLTVDGRLSGVLDFGGLAVGDPAGDVMAAFHLFVGESRSNSARLSAPTTTWARTRRALTQGLEALPCSSTRRDGRDGVGSSGRRSVLMRTVQFDAGSW